MSIISRREALSSTLLVRTQNPKNAANGWDFARLTPKITIAQKDISLKTGLAGSKCGVFCSLSEIATWVILVY
jgi:hypothetical protein